MNTYVNALDLLGKTLVKIDVRDDEIYFTCDDGTKYKMYHMQDCCENVYLEDVIGDIDDLLNHPLLEAEEVSCREPKELPSEELMWLTLQSVDFGSYDESQTWTFYKFRTVKGCVTLRWYGTSNGYYSENVDLIQIAG
jgi:hypothetical protein